MIDSFPPGMIMVIGALLIPFLPHIVRQIFMMLLVLLSAYPLTLGIGVGNGDHELCTFSNLR